MQKMKTIRHRFTAFIPFMLTIAVLCCLLGNGLPRAAAVQADTDSYYLSENSNVDTIRPQLYVPVYSHIAKQSDLLVSFLLSVYPDRLCAAQPW